MRHSALVMITNAMICATALAGVTRTRIADYGSGKGGNLYVPDNVGPHTPVVLLIHGGAWASGDAASCDRTARSFAQDLGFVVFNIDYRLADGTNNLWPTSGNDCIVAANYLHSTAFKRDHHLSHSRIWLCGISAGGHLALWTLVNLPHDYVAGCISISAVGDPTIDAAVNPSRYSNLFKTVDDVALESMNPCLLVRTGTAPVLCTHMTDDTVVPIASHKAFETAYASVGNSCTFYEYDSTVHGGLTGQGIWIPGSNVNRLIPELWSCIRQFVGTVTAAGELTARTMGATDVTYAADGSVESVSLGFGAGNGKANDLWLAWGATDGGANTSLWEHVQKAGTVNDTDVAMTVPIPAGANRMRFFLSVPTAYDGAVPLEYVSGNGTAYIDIGFKLKGGDAIRTQFRPKVNNKNETLFGSRGSDVNDRDIILSVTPTAHIIDYIGSTAGGVTYADYRVTQSFSSNLNVGKWFKAYVGASRRSVTELSGTIGVGVSEKVNSQTFETSANGFLFYGSGSPSANAKFSGDIAGFFVCRDGEVVADYVPYRVDGQYGFIDRVGGTFKTAAGLGGGGETSALTPLVSQTKTISAKVHPRSIAIPSGVGSEADLVFGPDNGLTNRLYCAWGRTDGGNATNGWQYVEYLGEVTSKTNVWHAAVPPSARYVRYFLSVVLPNGCTCEGLPFVTSDGTSCIDTGIYLKGGDDVRLRMRPGRKDGRILGTRAGVNVGNISAGLAEKSIVSDYCGAGSGTDYDIYRMTATGAASRWYADKWYDLRLFAEERSLVKVDGDIVATNTVASGQEFTTSGSCWLMGTSGELKDYDKYTGDVASFSILRDGELIADYVPSRVGGVCGFLDTLDGTFRTCAGLTASADTVRQEMFVSSTPSIGIPRGLVLIFR